MKIIYALFLTFTLFSCNADSKADNKSDKKKELNDRSRQCIRIMNQAEQEKSAAMAAGDVAGAEALQQRIDSAARANVMIGQELQALDK